MYQSINSQIFPPRFQCENSYHTLMQNKTWEMKSPGRRCLSLIPFQHRSVHLSEQPEQKDTLVDLVATKLTVYLPKYQWRI